VNFLRQLFGRLIGKRKTVWRIRLIVLSKPDTQFDLEIADDIILGRGILPGDMIDLTPYDALELGVSPKHLMLRPGSLGLYAIDVGSHDRTQRNGRLLSVNQPYLLNDGDRLKLGNLELEVHILDRPAPIGMKSVIVRQPANSNSSWPFQPGKVLNNRYLILGFIDTGGFGTVYQALDLAVPASARLCAIKEILLENQHEREKVEREVKTLTTLDHPRILQIYDYFDTENSICLAMEFVQGCDLETILYTTDGFLPIEQVRQWGIEVCDILSYLHTCQQEPIALCGIKPSSLMINDDNHVRLSGFGLTKRMARRLWIMQLDATRALPTSEHYSSPRHPVGYLSPEYWSRGMSTPAGDIYALGATLYHLLTRRNPAIELPFSFDDKPISAYNPNVPDALAAVVMRALSFDLEQRYQSADEMKQTLIAVGGSGSTGE
jgi:Protein kinase domain/FHA domain